MSKPHRGRIQAQSKYIEESESWAQDEPPTWKEGLEMLDRLEQKLSKKEREKRRKQFKKARDYIKESGKYGGMKSPERMGFQNDKFEEEGARVDIEVQAGWFAVAVALVIFILIAVL